MKLRQQQCKQRDMIAMMELHENVNKAKAKLDEVEDL